MWGLVMGGRRGGGRWATFLGGTGRTGGDGAGGGEEMGWLGEEGEEGEEGAVCGSVEVV